jgi:hypothetical protein
MKLNYFIVGAPKCGTTSLFYYLVQHPNVYDPKVKEPHFLCTDFPRLRTVADESAYKALFSRVKPEHLRIGEASVSYLYSDVALERIRQINPDAKLLVIVRNPADLVYSWHSHSLATLNESEPDFRKAWALQQERAQGRKIPAHCLEPFFLQYRQLGMLGSYVKNLYEKFPQENVKVLFTDDLRTDAAAFYRDVLDFLGLPPFPDVQLKVMNVNRRNRSTWLAAITERHVGGRYLRRLQWLKKILGLQGVNIHGKLRKINQVRISRDALDPQFRRLLLKEFESDIKLLSQLTGRDLGSWLNPVE